MITADQFRFTPFRTTALGRDWVTDCAYIVPAFMCDAAFVLDGVPTGSDRLAADVSHVLDRLVVSRVPVDVEARPGGVLLVRAGVALMAHYESMWDALVASGLSPMLAYHGTALAVAWVTDGEALAVTGPLHMPTMQVP